MRTGDTTTPLRLVIVGLTLLLTIATGCSEPSAKESVRGLTWSRIPLPATVAASSLAVTAGGC